MLPCLHGEQENWKLRAEVQLPADWIQSEQRGKHTGHQRPDREEDFQCYHADLGAIGLGKQVMGAWDFHTPGRKEHRCFRGDSLIIDKNDKPTITPIDNGLKEEDIRKEDWNAVYLLAKENYFKFVINGKTSAEFKEDLPKEKRLHEGMIQLQLHNPKMLAEFKDLQLRIID